MPLTSAQGGETSGAFTGDQRFETCVNDGGLLPQTGETLGFLEQLVVEDQRGSHTYQYASYICMAQRVHRDAGGAVAGTGFGSFATFALTASNSGVFTR